ncbi:MAG: hypothetical protein ABL878_03760 [Burkholderiales bacterium]
MINTMPVVSRTSLAVLVAGAALAAFFAPSGFAQQRGQRTQQQVQPPGHYDTYMPSSRLRTRRDQCMAKETLAGAYCVKSCQDGYTLVQGSRPPKCRSLKPLPAGQLSRSATREISTIKITPSVRLPSSPGGGEGAGQ